MLEVMLILLYLLPTIVAVVRKRNVSTVAVINILFGWTIIGWAIAFAMTSNPSQRKVDSGSNWLDILSAPNVPKAPKDKEK